MADYSQLTDFSVKDGLSSGDPEKIILGADIDDDLGAISTAIASKYDTADRASQAQAQALTSNTVLITPNTLNDALNDAGGMLKDIGQLADPGADTLLGWDDSATAAISYTLGSGLSITTTVLSADLLGLEALADPNADSFSFWDDSAGAFAWGTFNEGIEFSGVSTVGLTDVVAGAAQPVVITTGTFTFDLSSITEITGEGLSQSADGFLVSDAGVLKTMPYDQSGVKVVAGADTNHDFTQVMTNTIQVHNSVTSRVWTIKPDLTYDAEIGSWILINAVDTGTVVLTADTGVALVSTFNPDATTTASSLTVTAGGSAVIYKTAADQWSASGDIGT